jgi:hypothetical protein
MKWFLTALAALSSLQAQPHKFAVADYTQGKVFVIDAAGAVEWQYDAPYANDLWVLPNGNLLFNTGHGAKEVTREYKVVFAYESASEVFACQRLANGNTFIGECSGARLLEISPAGKIVKDIHLLPKGEDGGHAYMRNARRLANGHYLVCHYGLGVVREYDGHGGMLREIAAKGGPHSAIRLADGNTLIACGDTGRTPARIFEVSPAGRVVWEISANELPGIELKFIAGFDRLPNGNTVFCNWLGHGESANGPHIIEVTRKKEVVWTYADHQTLRTASSVYIMDTQGTMLH